MGMNWRRAILAWLLIIAAETVNGILRRLFLVPVVGELPAHQVGVLIASVIIFTFSLCSVRWIGFSSFLRTLQVGALWVVLTLFFEFGLGRLLGVTMERMLADYDLSRGGLMLFGLLFMLFAPSLAARLRGVLSR